MVSSWKELNSTTAQSVGRMASAPLSSGRPAICAVQGLVPDETVRAFARTFGGVEHRIELVRERRTRWHSP